MSKGVRFTQSALLIALVAGSAMGRDSAIGTGGTIADLAANFPGVQVHRDQGRISMIYGVPMTAAATPFDAASIWLADYSRAFGAQDLELDLVRSTPLSGDRFTAFAYDQMIDGVPVEFGAVRVLVRHGDAGGPDQVVLVSATIAITAESDYQATPMITAADAIASVAQDPAYLDIPTWNDADLAVYFGDGLWTDPVLTWKFVGEEPGAAGAMRLTFFVDATTGELVEARNEIYYEDVAGNLRGMGSPGTLPDIASNAPVALDMPNQLVGISGGNSVFTNPDGSFVIPHGGTSQVTVTSAIINGQWHDIDNAQGGEISVSGNTTPPGPIDLLFNASPSEFNTGQVNGAVQTALIHNYMTDRTSFPGLNTDIQTNVNFTSASGITGCNAFFTISGGQPSINFFREINGCVNTAYSTVVAHEYGHFIVSQLGLSQGAFGEGYGDTVAMLLHDTNIMGENFFLSGGHIRTPQAANKQYPCSGAIHDCGQLVAGTWYDMRDNYVSAFGLASGLDQIRQLQVDWSMITSGGSGSNSAHPGTAIEVLTIDDNDGNLNNGTPNFSLICAAFADHNIDCPAVQNILFEYPSGRPANLDPNAATTFPVNIIDNGVTPDPTLSRLTFSADGGPDQIVFLTHNGGSSYTASVPPNDCGETVDYFITGASTGGAISVNDPAGAPGDRYSAVSADGFIAAFDDNFQTNKGWSVSNSGGLSDGAWTRGVPVNGQRGDPPADFDGSGQCYVTDNVSGNSDVDDGTTTLSSPNMDATGGEAFLSYARWYDNSFGSNPGADIFVVEVSNNGGATWTNLETVGPSDAETSGGWFHKSFKVSDTFATPSNQFRVRFSASDLGGGSVVEAGVDAVELSIVQCNPNTCAADLTGSADPNDPGFGVPDGILDANDFFFYLGLFGAGDLSADLTGSINPNDPGYGVPDGSLDANDFFFYLDLFAAGCP